EAALRAQRRRHDGGRVPEGEHRPVLAVRDRDEAGLARAEERRLVGGAVVEVGVGQEDVVDAERAQPPAVRAAREIVGVERPVLWEVVLAVPAPRERDAVLGEVVRLPVAAGTGRPTSRERSRLTFAASQRSGAPAITKSRLEFDPIGPLSRNATRLRAR